MRAKIQIQNGQVDGCTAKEAMKQVVEYSQTKSAHAIEIFTVADEKGFEAEELLFVKMFMRFLHKNQGRVLLLAKDEATLSQLVQYVTENYAKIRVVEIANLQEHGISADMILNRINGAEAEYIIASLPTELQDDFMNQHRSALDAKIWFGIGTCLKQRKQRKIQTTWNRILEKAKKLRK